MTYRLGAMIVPFKFRIRNVTVKYQKKKKNLNEKSNSIGATPFDIASKKLESMLELLLLFG